jgi:hypothetical protein
MIGCLAAAVCIFASIPLKVMSNTTVDAGSNLIERPKRELFTTLKIESLDDSTREMAEQLEILSMLKELYSTQRPTSQRNAWLREKIQETILQSYFDAASVQAEATREQSLLEFLRESLISRRDRSVEITNARNFIASGTLNTVGSALGFSSTAAPFPGNLNQLLSGMVSTSMSMYALKQNNGGKTTGLGAPTILAELFGRPTDMRTCYPESVWRFLHGTSMDHPPKTRVQVLEDSWVSRHFLEPHGTALETAKVDMVCGAVRAGKRMTINDLSDEINMISDISGVTELMTHHLRDLLRMIDSDVSESFH